MGLPRGLQLPLDKATLVLRGVIRWWMERSGKGASLGTLKFKLTAMTGRNHPPVWQSASLRAASHRAALLPLREAKNGLSLAVLEARQGQVSFGPFRQGRGDACTHTTPPPPGSDTSSPRRILARLPPRLLSGAVLTSLMLSRCRHLPRPHPVFGTLRAEVKGGDWATPSGP